MIYRDAARRLGLILTPVQHAYRRLRRDGVSKPRARELARRAAPGVAAAQMLTILDYVQRHAEITLPPTGKAS